MTSNDHPILGLDIGGVNIKAVRLDLTRRKNKPEINAFRAAVRPFEIWRKRDSLIQALQDMRDELGLQGDQKLAVTMTAELSDVFRTKREGVVYVLRAVEQAFKTSSVYTFNLGGRFSSLDQAHQTPLWCAATNWLASALCIGRHYPDCILVDIGSTTTDIIPIRGGKAIGRARTDIQRLTSGELVYTGVLRTNPNTVVNQVPVKGRPCRVAAEYFACMADVYLVLGHISPDQYTCPTADGRDKTVPEALARLSRLVCSDPELMPEKEIFALARYLLEKQQQQVAESLFQVLSGLQNGFDLPLAAVGAGAFLTKEAARRLGLSMIELEREWDHGTLAAFPAFAVAYLLALNSAGTNK